MKKRIKVAGNVITKVSDILPTLEQISATNTTVSFDLETRSMYSKKQRKEAEEILKISEDLTIQEENNLSLIVKSSGLSHPSIVDVTHVIVGVSEYESYVFVCYKDETVKFIFDYLLNSTLHFVIHNSSFDMKVVRFISGRVFSNFTDTQLLSKTLINDCDSREAKVGLKLLTGHAYDPNWALDVDYEVEKLTSLSFLNYCAIDGSSTLYLYNRLMEEMNEHTRIYGA